MTRTRRTRVASPERHGRARSAAVVVLAAVLAVAACSGPVASEASVAAAGASGRAADTSPASALPSLAGSGVDFAAPSPARGSPIPSSIPSAPAAPGPDVAASSAPPASPPPSRQPGPDASPLPGSQHGFRFRGTVVPMAFPLAPGAGYAYANDFLAPRLGAPHPYNNVRGRAPDGTLLRAHDGIDVHVRLGTAVVAPFSGTVIDPATRWKPWDPAMYGRVVAIVSDEPASTGYAVLLVHLSRQLVGPGAHVKRGQRVGFTGNTGNAAATPPHLHVELRAPFLLRVRENGVIRMIDAFDPFPSLVASDPRRKG